MNNNNIIIRFMLPESQTVKGAVDVMLTQETITKICPSCGQTKSTDEFHRETRSFDGLTSHCKKCKKLYQQNKTDRIHRKKEDIEYLPEEKKCSVCKQIKLQSEFNFCSSSLDGLQSYCIKCNKKIDRDNHLELNYGTTQAQYDLILKSQNGVCAICGKTPKENNQALAVDHNHKTNKIRGLLCNKCNRGIGHFNDDPELLRIGANYLDSHA